MSARASRRAGAALGVILLTGAPVLAGPRLLLGRPEARRDDTLAVPVVLRTGPRDGVAALRFRVDAGEVAGAIVAGASSGVAARRSRARLVTTVPADTAMTVELVPRFGLPLPRLRAGRVVVVLLRGATAKSVRSALRLTDVSFADIAGNVVPAGGGDAD